MQVAAASVTICKKCGVVAPAQGVTCEVCQNPLAAVRRQAPPLPVDQAWVALRCGFTCNSCRFLAPLDSLDVDGAVECAHCGLRQRFEVSTWRPALDFAHNVADLAGPNPEGRHPHPVIWIGTDNPHRHVGDQLTFEHSNVGALSIDAAPGHPVCDVCAEPLEITMTGPGSCHSLCRQCGQQGSYQMADAARGLYGSLLAVVGVDHRTDRPTAKTTATQAGVMALTCPSCGAPLTLEGKTTIQTCQYCKTSSVVPHRSLSRALSLAINPVIWWVLLRGVSPKRAELQAEQPVGQGQVAVAQAFKLLKGAVSAKGIGDAPGVYAAPEVQGFNFPQFLFTIAVALVAILIAFVATRFIDLKLF